MNKQFFGIIVVVVGLLVGVFALTGGNKDESSDGGNTAGQPSNHVVGSETAKVTLTEYGDFQCPACKSYFPFVSQIKQEYADKIKFQFRHYPLTQIHPNAFLGSRAAEAAGKQNKFFEMHDILYENQETWSASQNPTPILESYATQLGLNLDQFKSDMNSSSVAATINADAKAAQALGATSTPTFVINDKKIDKNPQSLEDFKKLIDDELAKNQ